ncbi:fibronectin type III domain-containing protein [Fulvivirga ligni]|uniref:fibronectin type III domain-containing protein n=1 Tax=Fulvivirga ligni TaxID=2904246 RepID=UPI001F3BE7F3|nr:fibronectin type III domain-containing protein [Fulvivirga ligni]UII19715.1 fibronectin type III domain-containing protein [Fulvivirga ligni]
MRNFTKIFLLLMLSFFGFSKLAMSQVPIPDSYPPNGDIYPWGYEVFGTNWDTSPYIPLIYNRIPVRLLMPKGVTYDSATNTFSNPSGVKHRVILFLHGAGEDGTNNGHQLRHGGKQFLEARNNDEFDGFAIFPQNYSDYFGPTQISIIKGLLNNMEQKGLIDPYKVVINGLSAGGSGVWNFVHTESKIAAAAIPISAANVETLNYIENFKYTPLYMCQGGQDKKPTPGTAFTVVDGIQAAGGQIKLNYYEDLGHSTWYRMWAEDDFWPFVMSANKVNPLVLFGRNEFCPDETVESHMGLNPGFEAYQWRKDGVVISGATTNEYVATEYGTYDARVKRNGVWSYWSPQPVVVSQKEPTVTPPIALAGLQSTVIPAPNGQTTVKLELPEGYEEYLWKNAANNATVGTTRTIDVGVGQYVATVTELYGCSSNYSAPFTVVNANGANKPPAASDVLGFAKSQTAIEIFWNQVESPVYNETAFEIYRGTSEGGPYQLIALTAANSSSYLDENLLANTDYYYLIRAINNSGASASTNELHVRTDVDAQGPTAPTNLRVEANTGSTVRLSWNASTDNVGVYRYDVYKNGTKVLAVEENSATVYGLNTSSVYDFYVIARDITGNVSSASNHAFSRVNTSGLDYSFYDGGFYNVSQFINLVPNATGHVSNVSIDDSPLDNNFGYKWEGYIYIPVTGNYTFETYSDDGSVMYIGGLDAAHLVVDNDGTHGPRYRSGTVRLEKGAHSIMIAYFDKTGYYDYMSIWWSNTAHGVTNRVQIPDEAFIPSTSLPGSAPAAATSLTFDEVGYKSVKINWVDNASNETKYQILRSETSAGPFEGVGEVAANATSFIDTDLDAVKTYYYKVAAIGSYGVTTSAAASVSTIALPPAPTAPASLVANGVNSTSINLSWTDASTTEDGFKIYRSAGNADNFLLIATLDANINTFNDTELLPAATYYYKVGAYNDGGIAYSGEVNSQTVNTLPVIAEINDISVRFESTYTLPVEVTDADGDAVEITVSNLPSFAYLQDYGDGSGMITFEPLFANVGTYSNIVVTATDQNGGEDTETFNLVVNSNHLPEVTAVADVNMNESESAAVSFSVTDADADDFTLSYVGLPDFAVITDNPDQSKTITFNPEYGDGGEYTITINATDVNEGVGSSEFTLTVAKVLTNYTLLINFNSELPQTTGNWNNLTVEPAAGMDINGFITSQGTPVSAGIHLTTAWGPQYTGVGAFGATTGNNSGVYPDNVMKTYYFASDNGSKVFDITGLNPELTYNFTFFGSRDGDGNRNTEYIINGETVVLNASHNVSSTVTISEVSPTEVGTVTVTVRKQSGAVYGYLNALRVDAYYTNGEAPAAPIALEASSVSGTQVTLSWTDKSINETGFEIERSTDGVSFSLVETVYPNETTYTDESLAGKTSYTYRVRAINGIGNSAYSNELEVTTLNSSPVLTVSAEEVSVIEDETSQITFSASDADMDALTFSSINLPSFATLTSGATSGNVELAPGDGDSGEYDFSLIVSDADGAGDTVSVHVSVSSVAITSTFVNFNLGYNEVSPWNNFDAQPAANTSLSNLKDEDGITTSVAVTLMDKWQGTNNLGMMTGAGVYPDNVTRTSFWESSTSNRRIKLSGLDNSKNYNLVFFGSRDGSGSRYADYTVGSSTVSLNASGNSTNVATIAGIAPDVNGEIIITVKKQASSSYAYINALEIQSYSASDVPLAPSALVATSISKDEIKLDWVDNTGIEDGYELYRSVDGGSYSLLATLNPNTTSFMDQGLSPNTPYSYKVRAFNASEVSAYSNEAYASTFAFFVGVNFNDISGAPAPWNNLTVMYEGDVIYNLKDDSEMNTGFAIEMVKAFTGENPAGMQTGNDSGIYPDEVLEGSYYLDPNADAEFKIKGLNFSYAYNFVFFATRNASGNRLTNYTINGETVSLNASLNTSNTVQINNVVPDIDGNVNIKIATDPSASYGYLSSLVIQAFDVSGIDASAKKGVNGLNTELAEAGIVVYPTIVSDHVNVRFEEIPEGKVEFFIYDLQGKLVNNISEDKLSDSEYRLDLKGSNLTEGMNMLKVIYGNESKVFRIIKR